jgi:hypothetical protein
VEFGFEVSCQRTYMISEMQALGQYQDFPRCPVYGIAREFNNFNLKFDEYAKQGQLVLQTDRITNLAQQCQLQLEHADTLGLYIQLHQEEHGDCAA